MTLSDGNIFDDTEHHAATELLNSHFTSAKHLLKLFLSSGRHTTLVFPYQTLRLYSDADPSNRGIQCKGYEK